jgi:hypothetical protein
LSQEIDDKLNELELANFAELDPEDVPRDKMRALYGWLISDQDRIDEWNRDYAIGC